MRAMDHEVALVGPADDGVTVAILVVLVVATGLHRSHLLSEIDTIIIPCKRQYSHYM
jgi:hypothetical protein